MIKFNPIYKVASFKGIFRPTFVQKKQKPDWSILCHQASAFAVNCELRFKYFLLQ